MADNNGGESGGRGRGRSGPGLDHITTFPLPIFPQNRIRETPRKKKSNHNKPGFSILTRLAGEKCCPTLQERKKLTREGKRKRRRRRKTGWRTRMEAECR